MEDDIRKALINKNIGYLCSKYNLYPFQAEKLSFFYTRVSSKDYRDSIVKKIILHEYCTVAEINMTAKRICEEALIKGGEEAVNFLCDECGYSMEEAIDFVNRYNYENRALDSMLDMEIDIAIPNKNIIMNSMINEIIPRFLDDQKQKTM